MILKKASLKAIRVACENFHYAKSVPARPFGYSVFNDDEEWCGVIIFGRGANNHIATPYGLSQGEVIELVRVALNGNQKYTSEVVAIALKLIKKDVPLAKLIISYADEEQNHKGIIYQATNWYYVGTIKAQKAIDPATGELTHFRKLHTKYGSIKGLKIVADKPKHKYIYPLTEKMRLYCASNQKKYPKQNADMV